MNKSERPGKWNWNRWVKAGDALYHEGWNDSNFIKDAFHIHDQYISWQDNYIKELESDLKITVRALHDISNFYYDFTLLDYSAQSKLDGITSIADEALERIGEEE